MGPRCRIGMRARGGRVRLVDSRARSWQYRGHDGMTEHAAIGDARGMGQFCPEVAEVIECAPETLITLDIVRARGKGSGIDMEARAAMLWNSTTARSPGSRCSRPRTRPSKPCGCRSSRCPREHRCRPLDLRGMERGDYASDDWAHPEIEFVATGDTPNPGSWNGLAGMAAGWRDWLSAWEGFNVEAEEYRELDQEMSSSWSLQRPRQDKRTGGRPEMWRKGASVFHIHDGKVKKLVVCHEPWRHLPTSGFRNERGRSRLRSAR